MVQDAAVVRKWGVTPRRWGGLAEALLGGGLFHVAHGTRCESSFKKCNLVTEVVDFGLPCVKRTQRKMIQTYNSYYRLFCGWVLRGSVISLK